MTQLWVVSQKVLRLFVQVLVGHELTSVCDLFFWSLQMRWKQQEWIPWNLSGSSFADSLDRRFIFCHYQFVFKRETKKPMIIIKRCLFDWFKLHKSHFTVWQHKSKSLSCKTLTCGNLIITDFLLLLLFLKLGRPKKRKRVCMSVFLCAISSLLPSLGAWIRLAWTGFQSGT